MREVVVIGAGVFGVWTAAHLHAAGARVTLVDAYGPASSRSSSGDESRILRCGYGPDAIYSRMAWRSRELWKGCADRLAAGSLWVECGVLWLASGNDPYTGATRQTLEALGYPAVTLDRASLAARYPDIDATGIDVALLEPTGGAILARRAVQLLAADLQHRGVRVVTARVDAPLDRGRLRSVRTNRGENLAADAFVFACGAWLPKTLPAVGGRIRPTRQLVVYFGSPPGAARGGPGALPAWVDFPAGIYGVPDLEGRGMKVGIDEHGPPIDPDTADRLPDAAGVARARAWLARRVPMMAGAPVVETRVCQYENTATGDFLIDAVPGCENVWVVGGGSGHGFKHGPAVGELAARLVLTGGATEPRFSFASKETGARRAVY